LRVGIVIEGVYEQTWIMGGAVYGVLPVSDNRAESGQSWEPTPHVKTHVYLGLYRFSSPFFFWISVVRLGALFHFHVFLAHSEQ
jgi:hypothetical protein